LGLASVDDAVERDCPYAPPFSLEALPQPRKLTVRFPVQLDDTLTDVTVVLDAESMPPGTVVTWDGSTIEPQSRDVYDKANTVFVIPAAALTPGAHRLQLIADVTTGAQGILERPILTGDFLVAAESPLRLEAMNKEWTETDAFGLWKDAGMPESFGPVEHAVTFTLTADDLLDNWDVQLPPCIGVAEVAVNGTPIGRSSWEPRRVPVTDGRLVDGENEVTVALHGSWNDLFSRLNPTTNGLGGVVTLVGAAE